MPWTREEKIFCVTYLETKSFKTVSKLIKPINMIMIYDWVKKLKKRLLVLKADNIKILKNIDLMSLAQGMHLLLDMFEMTPSALV